MPAARRYGRSGAVQGLGDEGQNVGGVARELADAAGVAVQVARGISALLADAAIELFPLVEPELLQVVAIKRVVQLGARQRDRPDALTELGIILPAAIDLVQLVHA